MKISRFLNELIVENKLQETFNLLIDLAKIDKKMENYLNELLLLLSRYNQIQRQSLVGSLSNAEVALERNKIIYGLLYIIMQIDEKNYRINPKNNNEIIIQSLSNSSINLSTEYQIAGLDKKVIENLVQEQSKIKVLFCSSNPLDTSTLRLDIEMRDIENELIRSKFREKFEFIKYSAVRIEDLQDALLNHSPKFVHFSGHGLATGIALLNNKTDKSHLVGSEPLANLFKLFSNDIACVFLNSCYSDNQAKLIRKFIPNVIGMKRAVPDNTAIEFAKVFYKSIGSGRDIIFSFEFAKNSIDLNNFSGSDIPIIL